MREESRLVNLASAVVEGADINWDEAERGSVDDRERSIVRELRLLAEIADVTGDSSSKKTGPVQAESREPVDHPATWGHLRLLNQIRQGSFGTVYRAWDSRLEMDVALKLMEPSVESRSFDLSRALKEARLLARVRHSNVVKVLGADSHDGRFGLWMELINGLALDELIAAQGTMSAREAAAIGVDACHALAAVHRERLLHRDVKASNVMREQGGRILLMDFGAGRPIPTGAEPRDPMAGTPLYLAPELLAGHAASVAADIYSLGVLLFYLVTGGYPVTGSDQRDVARAHEGKERAPLRDVRPDLPSAFVDAVERALAPNPTNRYRTAGEFGAALAAWTGAQYEPDPPPKRDWRLAVAAAVAVAVLLGVAIPRFIGVPSSSTPPESLAKPSSAVAVPAARAAEPSTPSQTGAYQVKAAFYSVRNGQHVRLVAGSRVAPGDRLFLTVEASRPVFVYVVNQDEMAHSYLLFPLPGYEPGNPVGPTNRLPGSRNGEEHYWEVTNAGGREHFFVYVAPERLTAFEQLLAVLPRAEAGRPVESVPLSPTAVGALRGVGGLTSAAKPSTVSSAALADLKPLTDSSEAATGVWARRITFENPR